MQKGQGMIDGIINIVILLMVFAVTYPLLNDAVNTLQAQAGTTVDLISAMYLPVMAVVIILSIKAYLSPGRPQYPEYAQ